MVYKSRYNVMLPKTPHSTCNSVMILHRKGQSMLPQISGVVQPLVIHEPDVLLLSYFLADNNFESATNDFVEDTWVKTWLPHI